MSRQWLLAVAVVLSAATMGCERMASSTQRAWWDVRMVAVAPINLPLEVVAAVGEEITSPPWGLNQIKALTWTPVFALARHGVYAVFHVLDLVAYPLYLPFGPEPFRLYQTDGFPFPLDADQESALWRKIGLTLAAAAGGVVHLAAVAGQAVLTAISFGAFL